MPSFGEGLGQFVGAEIGAADLRQGAKDVNGTADIFRSGTEPYNQFGQSFLPAASGAVSGVADKAGSTMGYDQFMSNYEASPGVKYQLQQGQEAQNESAASTGQLLSGTNQRAIQGITNGIVSTGANNAYNEYLAGNNQQFGQLETSLGNMFKAIGVGQTATGQEAGVASSQLTQQSALAQAQAKNDQGKGSGLGSMFSGLGSLAVAF